MSEEIDYKAKFDIAMQDLKKCQKDKNLNSCMSCDEFFECKIRICYVKSAFDKMCDGEDKGFAF